MEVGMDPGGVQELPTSELVRLSNERLQPRVWDEDELPSGCPLGE